MRKSHRAAAVGLSPLLLLTAVGCTGQDSSGNGDAKKPAEPRPIISEKEARSVLTHYSDINNQSNRTLDADLYAEVAGGALHQHSAAQYQQFPAFDKHVQERFKEPFDYVASEAEFFIPNRGNWYMVDSPVKGPGIQGEDQHILAVFQRAKGDTWKMVAGVGIEGSLPELEHDSNGFPDVLEADTQVGDITPDELDEAVNDLYVSGGKKDGKALADSTSKRRMVKAHTTRRDWIKPPDKNHFKSEYETRNDNWAAAYQPTHPNSYSLRTADGGALTVFTAHHALVEFALRSDLHVVPSEVTRVYVREKKPTGVRMYFSTMNAVHLPERGKPIQLGGVAGLIGAS